MKKIICLILSLIINLSCLAFTSCEEAVSPTVIYTKTNGTIRPIKIYKTGKGLMTAINSKKSIEIKVRYKYYCDTNQFTAVYPSSPYYYNVTDGILWAYTNAGVYYSTFWGAPVAVRYSAELSFYQMLPIKLIEKENTYKITYYSLDEHATNDISKKSLENYKKVIEINKSDIRKIEY